MKLIGSTGNKTTKDKNSENVPGSTENKTTKDKNSENVPHLEITEVVLVHSDIVDNDYQQDSRVLYTFVPINCLVAYSKFLQQVISF